LDLARRLPGEGSHVFEGTRVLSYEHGAPCTVAVEGGEFTANDVVIATNFPIGDKALYSFRMKPMRSYVISMLVPSGMYGGLESSMLLSTGSGHSVRTQPAEGGTALLLGGEGHVTGEGGNTSGRYLRLEEWARAQFGEHPVEY